MEDDNIRKGGSFYKRLGLSINATQQEIKDKYHELAKKYHPDKRKSDVSAMDVEIDFAQLSEAYETLSDPQAKKQYDLVLRESPIYSERPDEIFNKPTKINVVLSIVQWRVENTDTGEILTIDLHIDLSWYDHRLKNFGKKPIPKDIWKPEVFFGTGVKMDKA